MSIRIMLSLLAICLSIIDSYNTNNISSINTNFTEPEWGWGGVENLVNWPQ